MIPAIDGKADILAAVSVLYQAEDLTTEGSVLLPIQKPYIGPGRVASRSLKTEGSSGFLVVQRK